jgi:hypothetical protein
VRDVREDFEEVVGAYFKLLTTKNHNQNIWHQDIENQFYSFIALTELQLNFNEFSTANTLVK